MRNVSWPNAAKINGWRLYPEAHTRGAGTREGAGTWARGSGARFVGEINLAPMVHDDALAVRAFLHSLRGRGGSFYMPIPGTEFLGTGTATVSGGAAADASTMTLASITSSALLVAGAYLTVGDLTGAGQLVQIVSVTGSDIEFRPRLRTAQSGGTAVSFGYVSGIFRVSEKMPAVAIRAEGCPGLTMAIEEFR